MMRVLAVILYFARDVEAVKVTTAAETGVGNLGMLVNLIEGLKKTEEEDARELALQCVKKQTKFDLEAADLRNTLTRLVGAQKYATTDGAGAKTCAGCGGAYSKAETEKTSCDNTMGLESGKATTAREAMLTALYCSTTATSCPHTDAASYATGDTCKCATDARIEAKQTQKASVAKQCKTTAVIMQRAISIYKGKAASFIQLSQEENLRVDAKEFLQSHSETERNAELLKLLHDFSQQVNRDCHQDLSDLSADISMLQQHGLSMTNTAESEKRAYETAKKKENAAKVCKLAAIEEMDKIHGQASTAMTSFIGICPIVGSGTGCAAFSALPSAVATQTIDWDCVATSATDRSGTGCDGSKFDNKQMCDKAADDSAQYVSALDAAMSTLQTIIQGQNAFFLQLDSTNAPAETALTQTEAVDFTNLITHISTAMQNEITKASADASGVNAFAAACEVALGELDISAGGTGTGGCTLKAGNQACADLTGSPNVNCNVCAQENQCQELKDTVLTQKSAFETAQANEEAEMASYETMVNELAAATAARAAEEAAFNRLEARFIENVNGISTAIQTVQEQIDAMDASAAGPLTQVRDTMQAMNTTLGTDFGSAQGIENSAILKWEGSATTVDSLKYFQSKTSTDCTSNNSNKDDSFYCAAQDENTLKLAADAAYTQASASVFDDCTKTNSILAGLKAAQASKKLACKVGVTKDLKEELHKMSEALQILQQAKTRVAGNA